MILIKGDTEIKNELFNCLNRMVNDVVERNKILKQIAEFRYAKGVFGCEVAKNFRMNICLMVGFL